MKALWWRAAVAVFTCSVVALPASAGLNPSEIPSQAVSILQIRIMEGEGGIHTAGTRAIRPLVVQITDETGKPVDGVSVSFRLPEQGASGHFGNGLRSEVVTSNAEGRAVAWGIEWGNSVGSVEMRVTAAKGEARAGTMASFYVRQAGVASEARKLQADSSRESPSVSPRSRIKWLTLTALVAGAAAGGVVAAAGASRSPNAVLGTIASQPVPSASPSTGPGFSLGAPVLTLGKP